MVSSKLTEFQKAVLSAFFSREKDFFLTGGAALAGYHLGHRTTDDLDLFTSSSAAFERARYVIADAAASLGASVAIRQEAPGFRRSVLERPGEALVVDTVLERVPQLVADKPRIDGIAVDPPEEIVANKLTAVVGRMEERDLVDLMLLERAGYRVEDALAAALAKDGACTPATLAWLLSQVEVPHDARLPAAVAPEELRLFIADLLGRLRREAHP